MKHYSIDDDPLLDLNVKQMDFQLPMHALYLSMNVYGNHPWFQRERVWPTDYQDGLIRTIVRRGFIPAILTTPIPGQEGKRWIIDGQQRFRTMMDFMAALEADLKHEPIPRHPDGKEYFYFRLTSRQQQIFMSALVRFTDLLDITEAQLSIIYLDLQNQLTLKTAERLWATSGRMRNVAASLAEHPYFEEIYTGKKLRMQPYQCCLYPVVLEMMNPPFADVSGSRLMDLSKRKQGEVYLPSDAESVLWRNLDKICHLFKGVQSDSMTEIILQYQAVWLLSFCGVDVMGSGEGALMEWYAGIERLNREYRQKGFMNLYGLFTQAKVQKQHWLKWIDEIIYEEKLQLGNSVETLAQLQRVTGWLRSNGQCPECNNPHVKLSRVSEHVFRPADAHTPHRVTCKNYAKATSSLSLLPLE